MQGVTDPEFWCAPLLWTAPERKIRAKGQKFFCAQRVGLIEPIATAKFSFVHFSFSNVLYKYGPDLNRPIQYLLTRRAL